MTLMPNAISEEMRSWSHKLQSFTNYSVGYSFVPSNSTRLALLGKVE
jgi:hypothetical protein